jgi:hypothetical protein
MRKFKLKELEVKDGRVIARFLVKTGLKATLFDIMFPQANPNLPQNWIEMRSHLQTVHSMTDVEFKALQKEVDMNLQIAIARYATDFPSADIDMGKKIVDVVIEIFADDVKYEETLSLLAHLYQIDRALIEALSIPEVTAIVTDLMRSSGFFEPSQPSTPVTQTEEEAQA